MRYLLCCSLCVVHDGRFRSFFGLSIPMYIHSYFICFVSVSEFTLLCLLLFFYSFRIYFVLAACLLACAHTEIRKNFLFKTFVLTVAGSVSLARSLLEEKKYLIFSNRRKISLKNYNNQKLHCLCDKLQVLNWNRVLSELSKNVLNCWKGTFRDNNIFWLEKNFIVYTTICHYECVFLWCGFLYVCAIYCI